MAAPLCVCAHAPVFVLVSTLVVAVSVTPAVPAVQDDAAPLTHLARDTASPAFLLDAMLPAPGVASYCRRPARCQRLNLTTCFGVRLPYASSTVALAADVAALDQVTERLSQLWEGLRHVPKCWAVIQPFLCALYMPRCDDGMVQLPSQEMCKMTSGPCRILLANNNWPTFPKCDDLDKFPQKCKNDARELKFNSSSRCLDPLVQTDNSLAFYDGVEGCGIQCHDPLFTEDEHRQIHRLIAWGGGTCLLFNAFTVVTFLIDWRSANKYPALVIFYINLCFLVSCVGWLAQFVPGARQDIVCRKDGTLRVAEPSAGENLSCVIVFVLIYYFLMAAAVWFVILTYSWHLSFQALGKIHEKIDKKGAYFHLVAWSLPLVLTITTMALGQIDGSSVAGVCFVGYVNYTYRAGFLLAPVAAMFITGAYFLSRGLITLVTLNIHSRQLMSEHATARIREMIVRVALFAFLVLVFVIVTFVCHVYEFTRRKEWADSFRSYIVCKISTSSGIRSANAGPCRMESRPSVAMVQLHLLVLFCAGTVMSSWVWTASTALTWRRFARRVFSSSKVQEPVRLKKHKVIAQAFAKRKHFSNAGRLSISFHSSHEDPVGLNLDINSVASQDFSSTWAAALPKLMTRRGALIGAATGSVSSQRRNSMDSEISYSVRRVSVESRRHSLDSQVSVQIAEVTATRKAGATPLPTSAANHCRQPRAKRRRRDFTRYRSCRVGPLFSRRGSTTSQESQLGAQILNALALGAPNFSSLVPNLTKRRAANAGLEGCRPRLPFNAQGRGCRSGSGSASGSGASDANDAEDGATTAVDKFEVVVYRCNGEGSSPAEEARLMTRRSAKEFSEGRRSGDGRDSRSRIIQVRECKPVKEDATADGPTETACRSDNEEGPLPLSLSDASSCWPELLCLAGSNSGMSSYTQHTLGGGKVRTVGVGPHVSLSDAAVQVEPHDLVLTERQRFGTKEAKAKGGQVFTLSSSCQEPAAPASTHGRLWLSSARSVLHAGALDYSYNVQRLVQELAEARSHQCERSKSQCHSANGPDQCAQS